MHGVDIEKQWGRPQGVVSNIPTGSGFLGMYFVALVNEAGEGKKKYPAIWRPWRSLEPMTHQPRSFSCFGLDSRDTGQ